MCAFISSELVNSWLQISHFKALSSVPRYEAPEPCDPGASPIKRPALSRYRALDRSQFGVREKPATGVKQEVNKSMLAHDIDEKVRRGKRSLEESESAIED